MSAHIEVSHTGSVKMRDPQTKCMLQIQASSSGNQPYIIESLVLLLRCSVLSRANFGVGGVE